MRAPADTIAAPPFLPHLRWVNLPKGTPRLRMHQLLGRPVLIEFWDFCRPNSIRTLPYLKAWHRRYGSEQDGLQVIGIHSPGFEPGRDRQAVIDAVARLEVSYPVLIDSDLEMWKEYENLGWPARYLFDRDGMLFDYHYGEGAYEETELAIQALLASEERPSGDAPEDAVRDMPAPLQPLRPEDAPGATLAPQTEDQEGAYSGPYEAGGVWVVLDGCGTLTANGGKGAGGVTLHVEHPGAYPLIEHERHTTGVLQLEVGEGLRCLATCFTPSVA